MFLHTLVSLSFSQRLSRNLPPLFSFIITVILLVGVTTHRASAQSSMFYAGEEISYSVSYLGVKLGTVKVVTEGKTELNGKSVMKCKAYIDSRPGIPFVELHTVYETWMDLSGTSSQQFVANTKEDGEWFYDKYMFDYSNKVVNTERWKKNTKQRSNQASISQRYNDGLSLFFCARQLLYAKKSAIIPTMVMDDTTRTRINFAGKTENVEIDAANYPIRTVYFDGNAEWKGVYGVTGTFKGWFSDDEARVPIKAKMKLYLGSADIELVSWKRGSWQPPKGE